MRSLVLAVALMLAGSCASAPRQGEGAAGVVADTMITAMARTENAPTDYAWPAFRARVTSPLRWHSGGIEPDGDKPGSGILQNALLYVDGVRFDAVARGSDTQVRHFSIDVDDAFATETLLAQLRARGAEISFSGDDESAMFYYVSVRGREAVQLEARRVCEPYESRVARDCRSVMTLNFEPG